MCDFPRKAWKKPEGDLAFLEPRDYIGSPMELPCGQCRDCRLKRQGDSALRCMHELNTHGGAGLFLTLTLSDEHLPADFGLRREHVRNFMKRLRKKYGAGLKYVGCGEYGESTSRPHYHLIVFGLDFHAMCGRPIARNRFGDFVHECNEISKVWGLGHVSIGPVTEQSARYVMSYMDKDLGTGSSRSLPPFGLMDAETGEFVERPRPFKVQSNRPGIGARYCDLNAEHLKAWNGVAGSDGVRPLPRYYRDRLGKSDSDWCEARDIERMARLASPEFQAESTPERRAVRAVVREARIGRSGSRGAVVGPRVLIVDDLPEATE